MKVRATLVTAVLASLLAAAPTLPASAAIPDPTTDPFFVAPANLADLAPGTVIRTRPVPVKLLGYSGFGLPMAAKSFQILVRSTDAKDRPAAVTATVLVPLFGARRQLLAYQPATDSLGATCEPSYTLQAGTEKEAAVVAMAVGAGLTVVVPDHQGPRHAYAAGRMAGHAVLDSVRGALATPDSGLPGAQTRVAMVGYSGGAIATGWAAQLEPSYAPEINLVGVASGGTPGDLEAAGALMDGSLFGGLFVGAALGMSREYPELLSVLNDKGVALAEQVEDYCSSDLLTRLPFASVKQFSDDPDPLRTPVAQAVLLDNKMGALPPSAPYLLWHAKYDELIPHASAVELDREWCARGADVQFVTSWTSEHNIGAGEMIPTALPWLLARFDGKPFQGNCPA